MLSYLQQKADLQLEARIDFHDYDESQLIEIRAPLQLPYQTTWDHFERCYGTIEIDGISYTYVKKKMADGYMILKCIPNTSKQTLRTTEHMLAKVAQGVGHEGDRASSFAKVIKCYIGDFDQDQSVAALQGLNAYHHTCWPSVIAFVTNGFASPADRPPDSGFSL